MKIEKDLDEIVVVVLLMIQMHQDFFDTFYREATFEIAKGKMLDNLKKLRDDIDELIKREIKQKSSTRL